MAKIDKIKERIGTYKAYLAIIAGLCVAIGAGVCGLYLKSEINELFWLGIAALIALSIAFVVIASDIHKSIDELEDM